jgi:hypothetical protein
VPRFPRNCREAGSGISAALTPIREVPGLTSGRFLTSGSSLPLVEAPTACSLIATGPLTVRRSFQPPAEGLLVESPCMGVPLFLKVLWTSFIDRFGIHFGATSIGDLNGHHPQCPIRVEGMYITGCCLVSRGDRSRHWLFTTPVPRSPWHDALHFGLGDLVL